MNNLFGHDPSKLVFVDIESDNLKVTHDEAERVYLIGTRNYVTSTSVLYRSVQDWLDADYDDTNTHVFHNASFDVAALRLRGLPLTNYFCTMVASHTFTPGSSDEHSLGALMPDVKRTLRELLVGEGYEMNKVKKGEEYAWYGTGDLDVDGIVELYLHRDLEATHQLYDLLLKNYNTDEAALSALININQKYIECILALQQGTAVEYDASLAEQLTATRDKAMAECLLISGWKQGKTVIHIDAQGEPRVVRGKGSHCIMEPFNPNSHAQVATELTRLYKWKPVATTKSGRSEERRVGKVC